jgi:lipoprotein-anchoring transpeptidase ErfK/SrfK
LLVRRLAPGSDRTIDGLVAAERSALQEGAGLELSSTEQLAIGLQPATLLTYEGWEASVRQVLTVRGNDAYSLLWLSHGRTEIADRAQLSRFLSTFEPSGSNSPAAPEDTPSASVPELEVGAGGPAVLSLQARLAALHYDIGAVDGSYGDDTSHAVVAFQKVNGLSPTGIADSATWSALFHPFVPKAKYDYTGTSIEVDLTLQVVYLVRDGKIQGIFDASTGGGYEFVSKGVTKIAITPTGTYRIYLQIDGWYESSVGWMYRSSFFLRGFALHGEVSVPPYPASHGCVRVTLSAINRLWPSLYLGMLVSIYRT